MEHLKLNSMNGFHYNFRMKRIKQHMNLTARILILITILFSSYSNTFSQDFKSSETLLKENAISFSALGVTPAIGVVYERLLSEKISAEIGIGFVSLGAGIKYYPWGVKTKKLLFHTGFSASASPWFSSGEMTLEGQGFVSYIPFGISYFGNGSLNLGANIGPGTSYFKLENVFIYGNLYIGFRF